MRENIIERRLRIGGVTQSGTDVNGKEVFSGGKSANDGKIEKGQGWGLVNLGGLVRE